MTAAVDLLSPKARARLEALPPAVRAQVAASLSVPVVGPRAAAGQRSTPVPAAVPPGEREWLFAWCEATNQTLSAHAVQLARIEQALADFRTAVGG